MHRAALAALLLFSLAACSQERLYGKLSETQANEMLAILQRAGIDADKEVAEEGWTIYAPGDQFARAVEVLHAEGYPRDEFATLGTVFKKEGFVSSPTEERARLIFGLSQELSSMVSQIDGVVQARVQIAMPEADPLAEQRRPPSASVFIKHQPGSDVDRQMGQIKALVVNGVEGLTYDNVTVAMFPARPLPTPEPPSVASRVWSTLRALLLPLILLVAALFAWPVLRRWLVQRRTARARTVQVEVTPNQAGGDGP